MKIHAEFIEKTRKFWSEIYGYELTTADAEEIFVNFTGFIMALAKSKAEAEKIKN